MSLLVATFFLPAITSQAQAQGDWVYFGVPAKARLRVENYSRDRVRVYAISRHGRWMWAADVKSGERTNLSTPVGQRWVVAGWRGGNVLRSVTAQPGTTTVTLGGGGHGGLFPPQVGEITFKNRREHSVYIYKVNAAGAWTWSARLNPGRSLDARTAPGQTWVVTNLRGNVVMRVPGTSREREIVLRD
jgi:hypothetical protein